MKYLLDEDIHPRLAEIARGLGLDVVSVHEIGRRTLSDREQLDYASAEGRVFVTRNRDDFIQLTLEHFRAGAPHAGVLIVPHTLPNRDPEAMAHALASWDRGRGESTGLPPYTIDYL